MNLIGIILLSLLLSGCDSQSTETPRQKRSSHNDEKLKQYLIGIHMLNNNKEMTLEEKAAFYKQLTVLTGFSAGSARLYLDNFQNEPKKWFPIMESMIQLINDTAFFYKE